MGSENHGGTCPYCGSEKKHINNHIRMSAGEHGAQGVYPEDWDKNARQTRTPAEVEINEEMHEHAENVETGGEEVEPPAEPQGSDGRTVRGLGGTEEVENADAVPIEFADDPADAREYECGACSTEMAYLDSECGECGQSNVWQGVTA